MDFYGLMGEKLSHSLSPKIHKRIFDLMGVEGAYKLFEINKEDVSKAVESLKILKIKGSNVTIPYKEKVMENLDFISPEAAKINAVNTIYLKDNKLYGYNTDYYGFGTIINNNNIQVKNSIAMILGDGGAAKAVIAYLLDEGINKIYLVSRKIKEANTDEDSKIIRKTYEEIENIDGDILINTTPVGMYPNIDSTPVEHNTINKFRTLIDIVYNPKETKFLKIGKQLNKQVCGGIEMLLGQAIKSQEIWQEKNISKEICEILSKDFDGEF